MVVCLIYIGQPPSSLLLGKNISFVAPALLVLFAIVVVVASTASKPPSPFLFPRRNRSFVVFELVKVLSDAFVVCKLPSAPLMGKNGYSVVVDTFVVAAVTVVVENEELFFSQ